MVLGGNVGFPDDPWVIMPWLADFSYRARRLDAAQAKAIRGDIASGARRIDRREIISCPPPNWPRIFRRTRQGPPKPPWSGAWPHASERGAHSHRLRRSFRQTSFPSPAPWFRPMPRDRWPAIAPRLLRRRFPDRRAAPPRARGRCGARPARRNARRSAHSGGPDGYRWRRTVAG